MFLDAPDNGRELSKALISLEEQRDVTCTVLQKVAARLLQARQKTDERFPARRDPSQCERPAMQGKTKELPSDQSIWRTGFRGS